VLPFPPSSTRKLAGASAIEKSGGGVTVTVSVTDAVRLPETPLTVICVAFAAAVLAAERVSVLVAVALDGLNDAVMPVGSPVAVKATVPLKPACGATVIVAVPAPPAPTFTLETDVESLKVGAAATVKVTVVCAVIAPDVAVTVSVAGPTTADAAAASFSVLVVLVLAGVKVAVTPVGNPLTASVAAPVNPVCGVTVIVLVPDAP
jgi:hypothetical protein